MCVERNFEALSGNYCCSGKTISITHSECVFVDLGIQHAMRMRHIVICGQTGPATFFHIIPKDARLSGKTLLNIKSVLISPTNVLCHVSHSKKN